MLLSDFSTNEENKKKTRACYGNLIFTHLPDSYSDSKSKSIEKKKHEIHLLKEADIIVVTTRRYMSFRWIKLNNSKQPRASCYP